MSVFAKTTSRYHKLKNVGDSIQGTILEIPEPKQSTVYNPDPAAPKKLDFWESRDGGPARPKLEVHLLLQTEINEGPDENGEPDDGERRLVVPIFFKDGSMMSAIQAAMGRAGAKDLEKGGKIGIRFTGHDPESANPQQPRKLFEAYYEKPAAAGGVFAQQPQAAQAPQQYQQPAQAPAPQAQQWQQPQAAQTPAQQAWDQQPAQAQWQQPQAAQAPAQQPAAPAQQWQAPQAVNPSTGELGQQWGQQPTAEPARDPGMYQQPEQPTPVQQQATAAFNGTAGQQGWQPPQAAAPQQQAQPAAPVQVNAEQVRELIRQGAPDGHIAQVTGASLEAITALRNL